MSYKSDSKLLRSSLWGGHFLELNPYLLVSLVSSLQFTSFSLFLSEKKALHRIRLITFSVFSMSFFKYEFLGGIGMFFIE